MIIDDLDAFRSGICPNEADTPLIIDPNAVLPETVALKRLRTVSGRRHQVPKFNCGSDHSKLPLRGRFDVPPARHPFAFEQGFGIGAPERSDRHDSRSIYRNALNIKQLMIGAALRVEIL